MPKKTFLSLSSFWQEAIKIIAFGAFSLILGYIKFSLPGVEGGTSDMREFALLLSVFYFRHWVSVIPLAIITSIGFPFNGVYESTVIMHALPLIVAYWVYKYLSNWNQNRFIQASSWFLFIIIYYTVLVLPLMVISYRFYGLIGKGTLMQQYLIILQSLHFEITATSIISALLWLNIKGAETLEVQNKALIKAKVKAEEGEELKTSFLQNLSHEIRTPLNGIMGYSTLLQSNSHADATVKNYTNWILNSSNQLLNIVNNIVDISQIETKQFSLSSSTLLIIPTINEVVESLKQLAKEKGINIHYNHKDLSLDTLDTNQYMLKRILYHLIDNAIKFSTDKDIIIITGSNASYLSIKVIDEGIGIDRSYFEIIFENFRQIDCSLTRHYGGNGLGLSICKGFAQELNGKILLESTIGEGSTFTFLIPVT